MSVLFVEYEFKTHVSGLYGEFRTQRIYDVYSIKQIEKLVDDVSKVLKEKRDCMITFQFSGDYKHVDILRFLGRNSETFTQIYWKRDSSGRHIETIQTDNLSTRKNVVRDHVDIATAHYFKLAEQE